MCVSVCVCAHECVSAFVHVVCGTYIHACMCGVCVIVCANIALQIGDLYCSLQHVQDIYTYTSNTYLPCVQSWCVSGGRILVDSHMI